jgi:hypothetical protein
MALNIIKLCVGAASIEDLAAWVEERKAAHRRGDASALSHVTRMYPRRRDEILPGGSLYWVIKGFVQVRQPLADIRPITGEDGIERCELVLEPRLVAVRPVPRRAFQGWRYFDAADAPPDLGGGTRALAAMPEKMRSELMALGLI